MPNVIPTKSNLLAVKRSLSLARLGYDLMDRKRNILIHEMMSMMDTAAALQGQIDSAFSEAYIALQGANITQGIVEQSALAVPVDNDTQIRFRSVMGVELPIVISPPSEQPKAYYGYSATNSTLDEAYLRFVAVKQLIRRLAEVENSIYRLAVAIKKTQKRANALKNVIIPKLRGDIVFITEAIEEKDREEFVRLKVIKRQKAAKAARE